MNSPAIEFFAPRRRHRAGPRPAAQVKLSAAELIQGLTGSPEGLSHLSSRSDALLPALLRLVGAEPAPARAALAALVNLSQEPAAQAALLALNAPARSMDYLRERSCPHPHLLVMLLANLTAAEEGAAALLQLGKGAVEGLNLALLLKLFLDPVPPGEGDTYEHVATVLPNVTRFAAGRRLVVEPGRGALGALASQLRSPSALRRRGCAGALKNCCFSCETDGTVGALAGEGGALAGVLGVLGGAGEAEADAEVRQALAEAVVCLARAPEGRAALWAANAADLLKKGYEYEEHRGVCDAMEAAASLLMADGFQPEEDGEGGGGGDEGGEDEAAGIMQFAESVGMGGGMGGDAPRMRPPGMRPPGMRPPGMRPPQIRELDG